MTVASPFVVHVGDLLATSGKRRSHRVVAPVDWGVDFAGVVPGTSIDADLVLSGASGGIVVRGSLRATIETTCARCLEEYRDETEIEIAQLVESPGSAGDDGYELQGEQVDLEPILRDELMLQLPWRATCPDGCAELEQHSETDLNTDTPDEPGRTSPFAVLHDLFDAGD